jgi:hypothetical protein
MILEYFSLEKSPVTRPWGRIEKILPFYFDSKKHRGHRKLNPSLLGHSTHFQIGGDNPKVEGQDFFYPSPGSGNRTLFQ